MELPADDHVKEKVITKIKLQIMHVVDATDSDSLIALMISENHLKEYSNLTEDCLSFLIDYNLRGRIETKCENY